MSLSEVLAESYHKNKELFERNQELQEMIIHLKLDIKDVSNNLLEIDIKMPENKEGEDI